MEVTQAESSRAVETLRLLAELLELNAHVRVNKLRHATYNALGEGTIYIEYAFPKEVSNGNAKEVMKAQ